MTRVLRTVGSALLLIAIGFFAGRMTDVAMPAALAQQTAPAPASPDKAPVVERLAGDVKAMTLPPEVKGLLEDVKRRIDGLQKTVDQSVAEARAKAIAYSIWAVIGLCALMLVSSLIGGAVAGMMVRRRRL